MKLILASTSPRRKELLARLGLPFTVEASRVDETPQPGERPEELAERLALAKARDVAARHTHGLVIGADTVVARHGRLYGKPRDEAEAAEMLRDHTLSPHTTHTQL